MDDEAALSGFPCQASSILHNELRSFVHARNGFRKVDREEQDPETHLGQAGDGLRGSKART